MSGFPFPPSPTPTSMGNPIALPPLGPRQASIAYTIKKNAGNVPRIYNPCGYTPIAQAEIHPSFGKYISRRMAIDIPNSVLAGDIPKPGDFFTIDGNTYNVVDCQNPSIFVQRVVGFCPKISYDLEDLVQYSQATCSGSDTDGSRTVTYTQVGSPIPASVQPMTSALGDTFGTKNFNDFYMVYAATDPSGTGPSVIDAGDLFTDQNGVKYEVVESMDRLRLEAVNAYRCVKKL